MGNPGPAPSGQVNLQAQLDAVGNIGGYGYADLPSAIYYPPGITAYTYDQGMVYSNGSSWLPFSNVGYPASSLLVNLEFPDTPSNKYVAFQGVNSWEGTCVQEPTVWYHNGLYYMTYTGGYTNPRIGLASAPTLFGPWTRQANPILGGGYGGYANGAAHSYVYIQGSTGYIYFVDPGASTVLRVATFNVNTPQTVTTNAMTWSLPNTGTAWGNVAVIQDGGNLYMMLECSTSAISWQMGFAKLSSPLGTMTVVQFPITSLQNSLVNSTATASGPWFAREGNQFVLYMHAGLIGTLPDDIYRAISTDLVNWTFTNNGYPVIGRCHPYEVDQAADMQLCQDVASGAWVGFWTGFNNAGQTAVILQAIAQPSSLTTIGSASKLSNITVNSANRSNRVLQMNSVSLAADTNTTSGTFVNFGITNVSIVAKSNKILARLSGVVSPPSAVNAAYFQLLDGSSNAYPMGAVVNPSGGYPTTVCAETVISVTPNTWYIYSVQAKVDGGTLYCRPTSFPANELLTLTLSDLNKDA